MSVESGMKDLMSIDGLEHHVGVVQVHGEWRASYRPRTSYRFSVGDDFPFKGLQFKVKRSGMSPLVPRMCLLVLERAS